MKQLPYINGRVCAKNGPNYPYMVPHQCDNSRGEIKLACGYTLPVVAEVTSPDG